MGAWDYGIFDDDTAYDFTDEIKADATDFFRTSFKNALQSDYLEYDDCHAVTVSAAYLDNTLNGTTYRTDSEDCKDESNVNKFGELHPEMKLEDMVADAVKALKIVISDRSELFELWSENEELFPKWKGTIEALIGRLEAYKKS